MIHAIQAFLGHAYILLLLVSQNTLILTKRVISYDHAYAPSFWAYKIVLAAQFQNAVDPSRFAIVHAHGVIGSDTETEDSSYLE